MVIAISSVNDEVLMLTEDFINFTAPAVLLGKTLEEFIELIPVHLSVTHNKKKVQELHYLHMNEM